MMHQAKTSAAVRKLWIVWTNSHKNTPGNNLITDITNITPSIVHTQTHIHVTNVRTHTATYSISCMYRVYFIIHIMCIFITNSLRLVDAIYGKYLLHKKTYVCIVTTVVSCWKFPHKEIATVFVCRL